MAGDVDVLLDRIDRGVARVRAHYERDLAAEEPSDELLGDVWETIVAVQSAFDMTADKIKAKFGPKRGRGPYFPLVKDPNEFEVALDGQIKGLRSKHPHVADAIERHQPFQPGKSVLGYLHQLGRINRHQGFTPQTRTEQRAVRYEAGGAGVELGEGATISIGGGASVEIGGVPIQQIQPLRITYVDWLFGDPPVSVLRTLEALARLVRDAVEDIDREAAL